MKYVGDGFKIAKFLKEIFKNIFKLIFNTKTHRTKYYFPDPLTLILRFSISESLILFKS